MSISNSLSILIVDDNSDHAELLGQTMQVFKVKYTINYAENGLKAIDFLENRNQSITSQSKLPEFIFLDIKMPLMDGITALKRIRRKANYDPIKIVMVSTSNIESEIKSCLQAGANSYLTKPVDSETLIRTLKDLDCEWAI